MSTPSLINKTCLTDRIGDGLIFDINIEEPDHYNDVVRTAGYNSDKLDRNCFFNKTKIGHWIKVWTEGNKLKAKLQLEPQGSSPYTDELRILVKCGAIRAVRASFKPIRSKPREGGGTEFIEQSLLTVALAAFGRNPQALMEAKANGVSTKTIRGLFAEQNKNASLAERIQDARFSVRLQGDDSNKPKLNRIYTEREKEEISRKAEQILLRAGYKIPPKKKTIGTYIRNEQMEHNRESLKRARAMIEKWRKEKAAAEVKAAAKARAEKLQQEKETMVAQKEVRDRKNYKGFQWRGEDHFVEWRGRKIPKSRWER
jgi:hypothetical protein